MPLLPVVHHAAYNIPLREDHPFPMAKFRTLRALLDGGPYAFHDAPRASDTQLARVHAPDYLAALREGTLDRDAQRRLGFEWSEALVERCRYETGGTCRTVELALQHGLACNTAGGTHHAHRDFGSGYCLLNDLAVAALHAREALGVQRLLIFDLDVHQGDGTAALLADAPALFTCSVHCQANFPARKQHSDLDIGLPRDIGDADYLAVLAEHLPALLQRLKPELVLYDAGVDVHAQDRLGYLQLSDAGLAARERYVLQTCRDARVPVAAVIGGGYDRDLDALCRRHAVLFEQAAQVFAGT